MNKRILILFVAVIVSATVFAGAIPQDAALINYASNLDQGDSFINITNSGAYGAFLGVNNSNGDLCANVYVFDPAQEMIACCYCVTTPDGLYSMSVKNDLISNRLTPASPTAVVVKILASVPVGGTTCNPTTVTTGQLATGMRAWATKLHANPAGGYSVTESPFEPVAAGSSELSSLPMMCAFVQLDGSGPGVCKSCSVRGLAGAKK